MAKLNTTLRRKASTSKKKFIDGKGAYLGLGILFGYFLSKAEFTNCDSVTDMFLLRELRTDSFMNGAWHHLDSWHLASLSLCGVILMAVAVILLGLYFLPKKVPALSPAKYVFATVVYMVIIYLLFHFWPQTGAFVLSLSLVALISYLLPPAGPGKPRF